MEITTPLDTLGELYSDLWRRWEQQFADFHLALSTPNSVGKTLYSAEPMYSMRQYAHGSFPPTGNASRSAISGVNNFVYRVDLLGRPTHLSYTNGIVPSEEESAAYREVLAALGLAEEDPSDYWVGIFSYSGPEATYAEFLLPSGVPCRFERVVIDGANLVSFQALTLYDRGRFGGFTRNMTKADLVEFVRRGNHDAEYLDSINRHSDEHSLLVNQEPITSLTVGSKYSICVENHVISRGRPISGRAMYEQSDEPPKYGTFSYAYSDDGGLENIILHMPGQADVIVYTPPSKVPVQRQADELSRRVADAVMEVIETASLDSPLVSVQLLYQTGQFLPGVVVRGRAYTPDDPIIPLVPPSTITILPDDLSPELANFVNRIGASDQAGIGSKMLRKAARQVAELARSKLSTDEKFFAFAVDWEVESDELAKILKECGARTEWIKEWKTSGLL